MLQTITIDDLKPGMFVNDVVEQTGMLRIKTKGLVNNLASVQSLKAKGVVTVEIDLSRSKQATSAPVASQTPTPVEKPKRSIKEQLSAATTLYDDALDIQERFFKRLENNQPTSLDEVKSLSHNIIDSVFEMPSALCCLSMLNKSGKYFLEHSLNCSILLTMFAQSRGFEPRIIEDLSLAGLLMDVGMTNMPKDITQSAKPLTELQRDIVTTHVDIGLDLVERCGDISDNVRDIIFNHHERIDGSGYPDSQSNCDVSEFARMAAIVDSYDAMVSNRVFKKAVTPTIALRNLLTDPGYEQKLVQGFVQCLGVHPIGSLVKLTNGKLCIVIKSNKKSPLQPTVASFYSTKSTSYSEIKHIDLSKTEAQIEASVRPEEFDINLTKFFKEIFVNNV
ncbi:HD domain-containing phosphohydrolase [Aliiglaciecola sp. LCG003]|uniref:HD-GYP domain-containing protein n=1 Tax=Aliiglaciecola sp. LCG003 TaxID=3053655 RepID=UPI0025727A97|nr:HD domain-containing phosphohydrolase [Aliiglaciecola sp. LCG003]WJG08617.1 DUF3391 domain-containing protein [Aliiglaciecola sp. LCG003]